MLVAYWRDATGAPKRTFEEVDVDNLSAAMTRARLYTKEQETEDWEEFQREQRAETQFNALLTAFKRVTRVDLVIHAHERVTVTVDNLTPSNWRRRDDGMIELTGPISWPARGVKRTSVQVEGTIVFNVNKAGTGFDRVGEVFLEVPETGGPWFNATVDVTLSITGGARVTTIQAVIK
jgi:hypothetical protein